MPRPSKKTDEVLIRTAQAMMKHSGLSMLNLRQVAAKAGVNLGMFHYHFKSKDQFIRAVLQDTYEKFFKNFSLRVEGEKTPLEKLRQALFTLAQFSRDHRRLVLSLLQDTLNEDLSTKSFVRQNMARHVAVLADLIAQCQRKGSLPQAPFPMVMSYLMTAATGSSIVLGIVEHSGHPGFAKAFKGSALSDQAIARRLDWILMGIASEKRR